MSRKIAKPIFYLSLFVLLFSYSARNFAAAKTAFDCEAAQSLLEKFLKLDSEIGRLSTEVYQSTFSALFAMHYDEPGWDTMTVIGQYKIASCEKDKDGFKLTVVYEALGELTLMARDGQCPLFTPKVHQETLEAHETVEKGRLKIDETPGNPHLNVDRSTQWIKGFETQCKSECAAAMQALHKNFNPK